MTPNMSRACDCCSRRKVRCDREQPCRNCRKSELICTYESKPKKRGPKGPTKVIQALRLLQAQQADDTLAGSSDSQHAHVLGTRGDGPTKRPSSSRRDSAHSLQYRPGSRNSSRGGIEQARAGHKPSSISSSDGSSKPNRHAFQPSLYVHNPAALKGFSNSAEVFTPHSMLTHSVVKACTDTFFENLYSIVPIFNRSTFTTRYLSSFQSRPKMYALVSSMCALTITQLCAAPISPKEEDDDASGSALGLDGGARIKLEEGEVMLSEALRARQYFDLIGGPDLDTVITTFFIFCCFRNLERHSHAWYYLRECITFAQELGLDDDRDHTLRRRRSGVHNTDSMLDSDPMDMPEYQAMAKRMYWLLFNTEREYAIQHHYPLTLRPAAPLRRVPPSSTKSDRFVAYSNNHARNMSHDHEHDWGHERAVFEDEEVAGLETQILSNFLTLSAVYQTIDEWFINLWNQHGNDVHGHANGESEGHEDIMSSALHSVDTSLSREWAAHMHIRLDEAVNGQKPWKCLGNLQFETGSLSHFDRSEPHLNEQTSFGTPRSIMHGSNDDMLERQQAAEAIISIQTTDIYVSRQWLHLVIWKLSTAKRGHHSPNGMNESEHSHFGVEFPVNVAKALLEVTSNTAPKTLEFLGVSMQEKIYDIGCSLADVISTPTGTQPPRASFELTRNDFLHEIVVTLSKLRGGKSWFFHKILQKVDGILELSSPVANGHGMDLVHRHEVRTERSRSVMGVLAQYQRENSIMENFDMEDRDGLSTSHREAELRAKAIAAVDTDSAVSSMTSPTSIYHANSETDRKLSVMSYASEPFRRDDSISRDSEEGTLLGESDTRPNPIPAPGGFGHTHAVAIGYDSISQHIPAPSEADKLKCKCNNMEYLFTGSHPHHISLKDTLPTSGGVFNLNGISSWPTPQSSGICEQHFDTSHSPWSPFMRVQEFPFSNQSTATTMTHSEPPSAPASNNSFSDFDLEYDYDVDGMGSSQIKVDRAAYTYSATSATKARSVDIHENNGNHEQASSSHMETVDDLEDYDMHWYACYHS